MKKKYLAHPQPEIPKPKAIRTGYEEYSVAGFYQKFGDDYRNPQEADVRQVLELALAAINQLISKDNLILDLACGSGEVTLTLINLGYTNIDGIDPYTYNAYYQRTGKTAETYTFEDIANGVLNSRNYNLIICSFALHLLAESRLPALLYQLSRIASNLIIITPHKRPEFKPAWGWICRHEIIFNRVRARCYQYIYPEKT